MDETMPTSFSYRLRRDAGGVLAFLGRQWQRRWLRWLTYLGGAGLLAFAIIWFVFARGLPSADTLKEYQPPLPTIVRDRMGEPIHSYARERRVQLEYSDLPPLLIRSYLAAEDRTFFEHSGIDYPGIASAIFDNLTSSGRARGASTITQQVAKNILLTNEYSYTRKIKEAILAKRIESALTKQQILELYLNEIPLGRQSFGVQAAAQAYFGKDVGDLALHEMAFLAILPKAPERYGRKQNEQLAIDRRNWVLSEMVRNGWISQAQRDAAAAMPLGLGPRQGVQYERTGGYFVEELRRQLIERFGEEKDDGPYSVYGGGLWVRSSMDPKYQELTTKALRDGLLRYQGGRAWKATLGTITIDDEWAPRFAATNKGIDYSNWRIAVALDRSGSAMRIGFPDGSTGTLASPPQTMKAGDITAVAPLGGDSYAVRTVPEVGGGMVVQNPHNGRVYAMQGGFDSRLSPFNRATQAERQPGSTIKPFVYAAAIDQGMTPASIIVDGPFCVWQGANLGQKCFRNFGGAGGAGPQTMRWGLEQSRNLMTVRTANDTGMPNVVKTFKTMGIGDYAPYLAFALGAGETTVAKMTNAYSMLVNHGRELKPTLIDFAQDRKGKVIWPDRWKPCDGCNMADWDGKPMPRFAQKGKQLMNPVTAYQVVHMLEGVVQRGTATTLLELDRPLFGKTGTTNGPTNVWFVGGSPDLVAGVYLGFDLQSRSLGGYAQGGSVAAPIFKQFAREAMKDMPKIPFTAPNGVRMVRIDRKSGRRIYGQMPSLEPKSPIIWEAFAAETEPKRTIRQEEVAARPEQKKSAGTQRSQAQQRQSDFIEQQGGIY